MEAVAVATAVIVLITALIGFIRKLNKDVQEIHVMVNSRMSEALERIKQLDKTLRAAGIEPPNRPNGG